MLTIEIRTTDIMGAGRPTEYRPEYAEDTRKLCLLGFTDAQLADFFDVSEATINNWKIAHPEFLESIKKGKEVADCEVVQSLYSVRPMRNTRAREG